MDQSSLFWDELSSLCSKLKKLEVEISTHLINGEGYFDDDVNTLLEALMFHVTTQFPVCEQEGLREDDASSLIATAEQLSEEFMSFFDCAKNGLEQASDMETFAILRKKVNVSIEKIGAAKPGAPKPLAKKLPAIPVKKISSPSLLTTSQEEQQSFRKTVMSQTVGRASGAKWMSPSLSRRSSSSGVISVTQEQQQNVVTVAARFYHCSSYDRPNQRVLFHGGLKRDKPRRLCAPSVYYLDLSEVKSSSDTNYTLQQLDTTGIGAPALCWHSAVLLDHTHWMLFGGRGSNNQMSQVAYVLDLNSLEWSQIPPGPNTPEARGGHCMVRMPDGDEFLLFGGMDTTGTRCLNDVHLFSRSSRTWRQQATTNTPAARYVHAAVVLQQRLWILGGLRGTLAKSSAFMDLWALDLNTWEWSQPKQIGTPPDAGTYCMVALDGESGTEIVVFGTKAFDDTREYFYVLSIDADDPSKVQWVRSTFPKKLKPSCGEGHTAHIIGHNLFILGGRPGNTAVENIDVNPVPRELFSEAVLKNLKKTKSNSKRLSQSAGTIKKSPDNAVAPRIATINARSAKKLMESLPEEEAAALLASPKMRDTTSSGSNSPRAASANQVRGSVGTGGDEVATLKEKLANLQLNFEMELSLRLEAESKAQAQANNYRMLREAYEALQVETTRFFELALSEVPTPAGKEKLQRRFEDLRSTSEVGMRALKQTSSPTVTKEAEKVTVRARKKDDLYEHHMQSVDKINNEINKLLPAEPSVKEVSVDTQTVEQPVAPVAPVAKIEGPSSIDKIWESQDLTAEFSLFVQHNSFSLYGDAMFCRAVYRIMNAPEKTRSALVESLIMEHIVAEADYRVSVLPEARLDEILNDYGSAWNFEAPSDAYWKSLLDEVGEGLHEVFQQYVSALTSTDNRPHYSMKRRQEKTGGAQHQLVANAETQLMQRLADLEKDDVDTGDAEPASQDEYLFKKVTSEMVATEINYVTDLKVTTTIFRRPLIAEKSSILPLEAFNIFANIEDVYALNRKFLTALQKEHGKPLSSKNYGKVFLEFAPQFQKVYLAYAGRKTISRKVIDQLSASNKKFVAFLEECLQKPPCRRLELKSFLIKPVQRICKYPLLLRTMVESAPKSYADKASLMEAKKKMEDVVAALEDQLFVEDDKMKMLELEGALNWHRDPPLVLAKDGRELIFDSMLIGTEIPVGVSVDEALMKTMRNIHLYLMTDILLFVEEHEKKGVRKDYLEHVLTVPYCVVVPVPSKAAFQILQPQQDFKYVFRCASHEQKLEWVKHLTDRIMDARKKLDLKA